MQRLEYGFIGDRVAVDENKNGTRKGSENKAVLDGIGQLKSTKGGMQGLAEKVERRENGTGGVPVEYAEENRKIGNRTGERVGLPEEQRGTKTAEVGKEVFRNMGLEIGESHEDGREGGVESEAGGTVAQAPGLLTPAGERKKAESAENGGESAENGEDGDLKGGGDGHEVDEGGAGEDEGAVVGDDVADALDDEEGGKAPVIMLGKGGKNSMEEQSEMKEENEDDVEGNEDGEEEGDED